MRKYLQSINLKILLLILTISAGFLFAFNAQAVTGCCIYNTEGGKIKNDGSLDCVDLSPEGPIKTYEQCTAKQKTKKIQKYKICTLTFSGQDCEIKDERPQGEAGLAADITPITFYEGQNAILVDDCSKCKNTTDAINLHNSSWCCVKAKVTQVKTTRKKEYSCEPVKEFNLNANCKSTSSVGIDGLKLQACATLDVCSQHKNIIDPAAALDKTKQQLLEEAAQKVTEGQIVPKLGVNLPGFKGFERITTQQIGDRVYASIPWIGQYIMWIYGYAIGISAVVAVVIMMIGGILWISAGGAQERITQARGYITSAFMGLILILTSYLLLNYINPSLVSPGTIMIELPELRESGNAVPQCNFRQLNGPQEYDFINGAAYCKLGDKPEDKLVDAFKGYTATVGGKTVTKKLSDPRWQNNTGAPIMISRKLLDALIEVETYMNKPKSKTDKSPMVDKNAFLVINSATRSLSSQEKLCDTYQRWIKRGKPEGKKNPNLAAPAKCKGGSKHLLGRAVDLYLKLPNSAIPSAPAGTSNTYQIRTYNCYPLSMKNMCRTKSPSDPNRCNPKARCVKNVDNAHLGCMAYPNECQNMLYDIMRADGKSGLKSIVSEWWHWQI